MADWSEGLLAGEIHTVSARQNIYTLSRVIGDSGRMVTDLEGTAGEDI